MIEEYKVHSFTRYKTRDQDLGKGVVRLHNSWQDKLKIKRGALIKITAHAGGCRGASVNCIYRAGSGKGLGEHSVGLEYDYRLALGVSRVGAKATLEIEKAGWLDWLAYLKDHPDPTVKAQFLCTSWLTCVGIAISLLALT